MMSTATNPNLWKLTPGGFEIAPAKLAAAIECQIAANDLDFRTRLLIRDSLNALEGYWGPAAVEDWLAKSPVSETARSIWKEELGPPGFPSLEWRVMEPTTTQTIVGFLRELSRRIHAPTQIFIGGSGSLIVSELLSRATDDIDLVDELPISIRSEHAFLDELTQRYGLRLAHFQSHYLPTGWRERVRSLDRYGSLDAYLVDPIDVFLSKVFSHRAKDLDDLRYLAPQLNKAQIVRRYVDATVDLRGESKLRQAAESNWYILYGEPLPV